MSAKAQGSSPVKDRVREYLDAHPGQHTALFIAHEINAPTLDVIEAARELVDEGIKLTFMGIDVKGDAKAMKRFDKTLKTLGIEVA